MKQFLAHLRVTAPHIFIVVVLINSEAFRDFTVTNLLLQTLIFVPIVIIPAFKTGRMSYVDIGWPMGLVAIGLTVFLVGEGWSLRKLLIGAAYLFVGGRMMTMALLMWRLGHFDRELPRYRYQKLRWQARGYLERPALLFEASFQGLINVSVLSLPAMISCQTEVASLHSIEVFALVLCAAAYIFESVADAQKLAFQIDAKKNGIKRALCNKGLWRYSRHPNYFGEWNVWNALVFFAVPSFIIQFSQWSPLLVVTIGCGLLFVSYLMYAVLTQYSGAVPAEYYSVQKRPGYAAYQRETNMFFPGPKKEASRID